MKHDEHETSSYGIVPKLRATILFRFLHIPYGRCCLHCDKRAKLNRKHEQ